MPQYIQILSVDAGEAPSLELTRSLADARVEEGEDQHTVQTLREVLDKVKVRDPNASVRTLFRGSSGYLELGLSSLREGRLTEQLVELSLVSDSPRITSALPAPYVGLRLDVDPDELLDVIEPHALFEEEAEVVDSDGDGTPRRELRLPMYFKTRDAALEALAWVAAHLTPPSVSLLVSTGEDAYEATLHRKELVTLIPLHPWLERPEDRQFVRDALPPPGTAASRPSATIHATAAVSAASKRNPARPLMTGSLSGRLASLYEATHRQVELEGVFRWELLPGAFETLESALRAPENTASSFSPLRAQLYGELMSLSPSRTLPLLLEGLKTEDEQLRSALYGHLSFIDAPEAHRVLADAFLTESPTLQRALEKIIWRQRRAVELLVREQLLTAWSADPPLARRIVHVIRSEHIEVEWKWIVGAPLSLIDALGPTLRRGA